ncbi:MAG: hypothetical protein AB1634_01695 [Thermodesulfobacteriota bacterium]
MDRKRGVCSLAIIPLLLVLLAGCVPSTVCKPFPDLSLRQAGKKVLLMPLDVELSLLNAGGVEEPNAAWTQDAKGFMERAFNERFAGCGITLLADPGGQAVALTAAERERRSQIIQLHSAVGTTILRHHYLEGLRLPNKAGRFDWSLGPGASFLKDRYGADYALFVYVRDSYASAGRVVMQVAVAALTGVAVGGGRQLGFASLVDLETGEIVWFNRLLRGAGDLRTQEAAVESVAALLVDFPAS